MKLFLLVMVILVLTGCSKTMYVDNQEEIEDNSIVFVKTELSMSLLIKADGRYSLVELENKDKIYSIPLDVDIDNLVLVDDVLTNVEYEYKYELDNTIVLDSLKIEKSDKILIELNNNSFCVYDKNILNNGDYSMCDFIYILNNEEEVYIKLNNNMKMLFYNEYVNFSSRFLEHLYTTWIDTYIINNDELVVLIMGKDDYIVKNVTKKI